MRCKHKCMHELCNSVGVGTFAVSSTHLVFSLVFFCKTIVYIGVTAQHESTERAATNQGNKMHISPLPHEAASTGFDGLEIEPQIAHLVKGGNRILSASYKPQDNLRWFSDWVQHIVNAQAN